MNFFRPNIDRRGRIVRGVIGLCLVMGGVVAGFVLPWLAVLLLASGVLVLFEALRGWCVLRACGIRTKV